MTDEQIKQNAVKYALGQSANGNNSEDYNLAKQDYLAGAHSRDEEIGLIQNALEIQARILREMERDIQRYKNPWISVEERLPESQQECELYDHAGYLRHGFYMAHKKKWIGTPLGCDIPEYVDITHWRYTEPPKLK